VAAANQRRAAKLALHRATLGTAAHA
jgi:hypothetical protein